MMGSMSEPPLFGHAMKQHFLFDTRYTNLNHGSFGTYTLPVRNAMRGYQKLAESAPDKFLRYQCVELLDNSRNAVARILNVPVDECVFVPNASMGVNIVLRNLTYKPNDVIIYFDTVYGAVEKTLLSVVESNPQLQIRKVGFGQDFAYSLPCTHADILGAFSQTISRLLYDGLTPKVAIFDTIVSIPGVRFPFERLNKMCKEYGIFSIIDGAHGIGQIPLNLGALDPDFFVSNCHKWLYTPRGCAVFHVPKRNQHLIRTTFPTSHGFEPILPPTNASTSQLLVRNPLPPVDGKSNFVKLFQYVATMDNTPYYCVPAAINFRNNICGGEEDIYRYIRDVAQRGAEVMAMVLGTEVMDDLDPGEGLKAMGSAEGHVVSRSGEGSQRWEGGLRDCAMANVLLPLTIVGGAGAQGGSLSSGPGGAGNAGGLSPFGSARRSPSPSLSWRNPFGSEIVRSASPGSLLPTARSPSAGLRPYGHSYSKSSPGPLPIQTRSATSPVPRRASPGSPWASSRKLSTGPITIHADDVQIHIAWMEKALVDEFNTFVAIYEYKGRMWTRVCGQIYLELKDFEWLGGVLKGLCERAGWGESLRRPEDQTPPEEGVADEIGMYEEREREEEEQGFSRLGRSMAKLNTKVGSVSGASNASAGGSATGLRRFDVRVGRWVDG